MAPPQRADKTPVQRIGKYEVLRVLGQGGMGTVYEARDSVIHRKVALKTMLTGLSENPDLRERFMREAQSAGGLRHRNIVTIYDFGEGDEGYPYIAMEFIEGTDLERIIQNREPHTVEWKLDVIRQLCDGLAFAHRAGIVHRDVKPANIRVGPDGEVKIMDFGIARLESSSLTKSGLVLGSAHYMSPEQIHGQRADHRSDIFAVGTIAFELLSGRKPFQAESLTAVMFKVTHERPDSGALPRTDYSPGLEQVILKALSTSPEDRYQSLDEMHGDLERVVREAAPRLLQRYAEPVAPADPVEALRRRVEHEMSEIRGEIETARAEGQLQKALALCRKLLELEPEDAAVQAASAEIRSEILTREVEQLVGAALSYLAEGDVSLAERIAAKIEKLSPDSSRLQDLKARLGEENQRREAVTLLDAAREHLVHGNLQEARAAAEEALAADPTSAFAQEILKRVSKVLSVREQATPPEVAEVPGPSPRPVALVTVPAAAAAVAEEEVFFEEDAPVPPTPIPVATPPEALPEPAPATKPGPPASPVAPATLAARPAPAELPVAAAPPPPVAQATLASPPLIPAPPLPSAPRPVTAAPVPPLGPTTAPPPPVPPIPAAPAVAPPLATSAPPPAPAPSLGHRPAPSAPSPGPVAALLPPPLAPAGLVDSSSRRPPAPAPLVARSAAPGAAPPSVAPSAASAPVTPPAALAPVASSSTPPAPGSSPAAAISESGGSGDRKAEAGSFASAAMNHFLQNNYVKARKAAQRALELDPANNKAKDLLKIMGNLG